MTVIYLVLTVLRGVWRGFSLAKHKAEALASSGQVHAFDPRGVSRWLCVWHLSKADAADSSNSGLARAADLKAGRWLAAKRRKIARPLGVF